MKPYSNIHTGGRKTIGNLFSKVKARFQEFDQSRCGVRPLFFSSIIHRCPRSTGQTSGSSTQLNADAAAYSAQGQAQPAVVTQPSYFDPNSHSSLIDHQSSPAAVPAIKGYDLSSSRSISK